MRRFVVALVASFAIAGVVLVGCSKPLHPPEGRWIGHHQSRAAVVDAWLEILPSGKVRISAPNFLDAGDRSDEQLREIQKRLAYDLSENWDAVKPRAYDFDGRIFRKAGGVAPQMEWDPAKQEMKVVFYFGMSKSLRIAMKPVKNFGEDPWLP